MADTFRDKLYDRRPDLPEHLDRNTVKRNMALALRALRKERGMTQKDVEAKSGLSQPMVSRLEAPTGALPNWDTVMRYVAACDGHMLLSFSLAAQDPASARWGGGADGVVAAVAL